MNEIKHINELLDSNHTVPSKVIFYVKTDEIIDKKCLCINDTYYNSLNPIIKTINSVNGHYISSKYDNIVVSILKMIENNKVELYLNEADFIIILHKDKCIAKIKNKIMVNSLRTICIDITEVFVMMKKTKYSKELLNCISRSSTSASSSLSNYC